MGLFGGGNSSSTTKNTHYNSDNKVQVDEGGGGVSGVSGEGHTINNTAPDAWEFAENVLNDSTEVLKGSLNLLDRGFEQFTETSQEVVKRSSDNANETLSFVGETRQTDLSQLSKEVAPWILGGLVLLNFDKILSALKGFFK